MSFSVHELEIPQNPDAASWPDFEVAVALHTRNEALNYGSTEIGQTALEQLPLFLDVENTPTRLFVVRDDATLEIIGVASYETEPGDEPSTAWTMIDVVPERRSEGVALALSTWLQSVAKTDRIRKIIVYAVVTEADGDRIPAPTGFGSAAAGSPSSRFLTASGFRLEQIVRSSRLALPREVSEPLASAHRTLEDRYRTHSWVDETPERWREDMAMLHTRMSTEEPGAGLDEPEEVWTVDRLIAHEQRAQLSPRTVFVTAVEDRASASLIGFTSLSAPAERDRAVLQGDTLVLPEHRGHRLGRLLKLANLEHLQSARPGHPSIITFNAEENRPMLDVNEALGFVPIGYEGAWRKDIPA